MPCVKTKLKHNFLRSNEYDDNDIKIIKVVSIGVFSCKTNAVFVLASGKTNVGHAMSTTFLIDVVLHTGPRKRSNVAS